MFFYGVGASIGPPASSLMLSLYGPSSLFVFTSVVHGSLVAITLWRMRQRQAVPAQHRGPFQMLLRTSPMMQRLARGRSKREH